MGHKKRGRTWGKEERERRLGNRREEGDAVRGNKVRDGTIGERKKTE